MEGAAQGFNMIVDLSDQKKALRTRLAAQRAALAPEIARAAAQAAQARLLGLDRWREAGTVALYMAFRTEMPAEGLLKAAWAAGKRVLLPRCRPCRRDDAPGEPEMDLAAVACLDELKKGAFGILEPDPATCPAEEELAPDLLVTPALAFDRQGFRLGYGGGYYDRYLARPALNNAFCVGLGYALQLLDRLPREPWDRPLHCICTEEEIIWP